MQRIYKGLWPNGVTYKVKARNQDRAWKLLFTKAWCNGIENPINFEVELVLTDTQVKVQNILKKVALGIAVLLGFGGFALANFTDTMSMSRIIPQVILALILMGVGFGIYNKIGGEYNV